MPRASTSPNLTRSAPWEIRPSASRKVRGSARARNEVWRSSTSGPSHRGGPWISSIISIPRACIDSYRSSMSSTRGVRWLMCVVVTPADVGGDTRDALELAGTRPGRPARADSANDAAASSRYRSASAADSSPCSMATSARASSSAGKSSRAARKVRSRCLEVRVEEAPVLGDQHRGEHPERVRRQLGAVEGPEGRRDDGDRCRRRVAQVVEPARGHAQGTEHPGHLGQLRGRAHPDRPVPLRGDPVDAAQAFGSRALARDDALVHLLGDLDQGPVGGHLGAVQAGQAGREPGAQLGAAHVSLDGAHRRLLAPSVRAATFRP